MLIFTGPTASGKTTLMKILCMRIRESGGKCIYFVSPPFGGLAYFISSFLSTLLVYAYGLNEVSGRKKCLAVLEVANPRLLSRVLSLLVFADFIFKVLQQVVFTMLEKVGFTVLVEDYYPQMIADHLAYYKLYRSSSKMLRGVIALEYRVLSRYTTESQGTVCIHVLAEEVVRARRELKRSGGFLGVGGFYNDVVRDLLPRAICERVRLNIKLVATGEGVLDV
jgi:energy-coupling factor transporter ATP-binding protein EcfA2